MPDFGVVWGAPLSTQYQPQQSDAVDNPCKQLDHNQKRLYDRLSRGFDVIVAWSPSAGKTRPIVCWALEQLHPFLQRHQVTVADPSPIIKNMIYDAVSKGVIRQVIWLVPIKQLLEGIASDLAGSILDVIRIYYPDYKSTSLIPGREFVATMGEGQYTGDLDKCPFVVAIYESFAEHIIKYQHHPLLIVFDETQEVYVQDNQRKSLRKALGTILQGLKARWKNTRFVMLTGSLHSADIAQAYEFLTAYFGNQRKILADYVDQPNRSHLIIIPDPHVRDPQTIKYYVTQLKKGTCIILFSKRLIDEYMNWALSRLPIDQSVYTERVTVNGQTYHVRDVLKFLPKRLAELAVRRVTYLYRDLDREYLQALPWIQALFSQGIIRVAFATDAIGKGVTLDIQTLIIPTIKKTGGKLSPSDLIQLVHRAGRGKQPVAKIICHPDDYDVIVKAALANRDTFVEPGTVKLDKIDTLLVFLSSIFRSLRQSSDHTLA